MNQEQAVYNTLIAKSAGEIERLKRQLEIEQILYTRLQDQKLAAAQEHKQNRPEQGSHKFRGKSIPQKIVEVLKEVGAPLHVKEIARILSENGVTTTSKHGLTPMVSASVYKRKDLFEKTDPATYRLVSNGQL